MESNYLSIDAPCYWYSDKLLGFLDVLPSHNSCKVWTIYEIKYSKCRFQSLTSYGLLFTMCYSTLQHSRWYLSSLEDRKYPIYQPIAIKKTSYQVAKLTSQLHFNFYYNILIPINSYKLHFILMYHSLFIEKVNFIYYCSECYFEFEFI